MMEALGLARNGFYDAVGMMAWVIFGCLHCITNWRLRLVKSASQ